VQCLSKLAKYLLQISSAQAYLGSEPIQGIGEEALLQDGVEVWGAVEEWPARAFEPSWMLV
jgi:hypothetical protein